MMGLTARSTWAMKSLALLVVLLCGSITVGAWGVVTWLRATEDAMLAQVLEEAPHQATQVRVTYVEVADDTVPPRAASVLDRSLGPNLADVLSSPRHAAVTTPMVPWMHPQRDTSGPAALSIVGFPNTDELVEVVSGRMPRPGSRTQRLPTAVAASYQRAEASVVEVALLASAARALNMPIGTYTEIRPTEFQSVHGGVRPSMIRVVGIYAPAAPYPSALDDVDTVRRPAISDLPELNLVQAAAVAADDATVLEARWVDQPQVQWTFSLQRSVTASQAPALVEESRDLAVRPWPRVQRNTDVTAVTGLGDLAAEYLELQRTGNALTMLALAALAPTVLVTVAMAASVLAARRRHVTVTLRARGASMAQLAGLRGVEAGLLVAPGLVGAVVASAMAKAGTPDRPALGAAVVAALTCALVVTAAQTLSSVRLGAEGTRQALRDSVQMLVVALGIIGTAIVWQRRSLDSGDPLLALVPALVCAAATLLIMVVLRRVLQVAGRGASRSPRLVPVAGLSQAAEATRTSVLPMLSIVLAMSVSVLTAAVTDAIDRGAERFAWETVGANVTVTSSNLDDGLAERIRRMAGVSAVAPAFVATDTWLDTRTGVQRVTLLAADGAGMGDATASWPTPVQIPPSPGATLVAAASTDLDLGGERPTLRYAQSRVPVTVAHRMPRLPSLLSSGPFVLVELDALRAAVDRKLATPDLLLITGAPDLEQLRAVVRASDPAATVTSRDEVAASQLADPLVSRTVSLFTAATVLAVMVAFYAVLLAVLLGAPTRHRTAALLRVLGADRRQTFWASALELVPTVLFASATGAGCGLLLSGIASRGLDLRPLTGALEQTSVRPGAESITTMAVAALALAALASLTTGWLSGRRPVPVDQYVEGDQT